MKFWRNLGELAEVKTNLDIVPDVYTIAFDPIIYASLESIKRPSLMAS